jgi:hypothetical protein
MKFERSPLLGIIACTPVAVLLLSFTWTVVIGQSYFELEGPGFKGTLHDNLSNKQRQGSGWTPLIWKPYPDANLFRNDAVGLNFEHIFNGAKAQHAISMFTPSKDECQLRHLGGQRYAIHWPSKDSAWGIEAEMVYDLSVENQVDLHFECCPTVNLFPQGFVAMMWASYMNRAVDRRIHFWGSEGDRTGWLAFGEGQGNQIETGTVSHALVDDLPFEEGAQTLNLIEHPRKKFLLPFYYGLLDGDQTLETRDDPILYLVLFDQTESIRFAMWNFYQNAQGKADTHSPAWDWQYVIRNPKVGQRYGYRARILVEPYKGTDQIWNAYRQWGIELGIKLPERTRPPS